jgi:hypothetical protein
MELYPRPSAPAEVALRGAQEPYALGAFASVYPDAAGMCRMIDIQPGALKSVEYVWNGVSVYVTAADQGSQFSGDVTITHDGCTVRYHAVGLWPGVPCDDGNGNAMPDLCNPCAEPDRGRFTGSGISPDARVVCKPIFAHPDPYQRPSNWCVLDEGEPPVLNAHPPTCEGG